MSESVTLVAESFTPIKGLSGFRKGFHSLPAAKDASSDEYVGRLAEEELKSDLEERAAALRTAFRFKRRELEAGGPIDGAISITTPLFDYDVRVDVDPEDLSRARTTRRLSNVRSPDQTLGAEFEAAFGKLFGVLEFRTEGGIDITEVVDAIEEKDDDRISVEYDTALTGCSVRIEGLDLGIEFRGDAVRLIATTPCAPTALLEGLLRLRAELGKFGGVANRSESPGPAARAR